MKEKIHPKYVAAQVSWQAYDQIKQAILLQH